MLTIIGLSHPGSMPVSGGTARRRLAVAAIWLTLLADRGWKGRKTGERSLQSSQS